MDASTDKNKELIDAIDESDKAIDELANNEKVLDETKDKLRTAVDNAAQDMEKLAAALEQAQQAMQHYDRVVQSGTNHLEGLKAAAE